MNKKDIYEESITLNIGNQNQIDISGSTQQKYTTTVSGSTKTNFTETATLPCMTWESLILTCPPKTNRELYLATNGIIPPDYYIRFVRK